MNSYRFSVILTLALTVLSGCANSTTGSRQRRVGNSSLGALSSAASGQAATSFSCPASRNIYPDSDVYLGDAGIYRGCPHKTDANQVKLVGRDSRDNILNNNPNSPAKVCVFPVEIVDSDPNRTDDDRWYVKPDLTTGRPLVICQTLGTSIEVSGQKEATYNFVGTKYNAVFVAEERNRLQMSDCLQTGNYAACPEFYSYGRFK